MKSLLDVSSLYRNSSLPTRCWDGLEYPGESGTVGVLTGTMGGRIGMGPDVDGVRLTPVLEEGVRRIVAVPDVMAPGLLPPPPFEVPCRVLPAGSPAVLAGLLVWIMRR